MSDSAAKWRELASALRAAQKAIDAARALCNAVGLHFGGIFGKQELLDEAQACRDAIAKFDDRVSRDD